MGKDSRSSTSSSSSHGDDVDKTETYPFPKYVGFILGNEFCERYAFYGMRTILVLYLTYFIGFDEDTSTVVYHGFTVLAYMFPLLGGAIADGYWGKYKTILWLSIIYGFGMAVFAISALPQLSPEHDGIRTANAALCITGLLIIAFGTGGIKPCVSSFGGDQFEPGDKQNRDTFFDLFYWAVNAGSLISSFLSPLLRQTTCGVLGTEDSCYFIAFAIPVFLMALAVTMFVFGTKYYRRNPPSGSNIFVDFMAVIFYGAIKKAPEEGQHWLYGAAQITKKDGSRKYEDWLIRDTTYAIKVIVILMPMSLFWAAFDQQGSRWTLQAVRMNGYVSDSSDFHLLPDQAQLINPILILSLIPVFNYMWRGISYLGYKCFGIELVTSLRKIALGMSIAGIAYLVSASVQSMIDVNLTVSPEASNEMSLRVINMYGRSIQGTFDAADDSLPPSMVPFPDKNAGVPANLMTIPEGEGSLILACQNGGCDTSDGSNPHSSTAEVILPTNQTPDNYKFYYMYDNFQDDHDCENASATFDITDGRLVWNLAVFGNTGSCVNGAGESQVCQRDNFLNYPGWTSKDPSGLSHIVLLSALQEDIEVSFECTSSRCSMGSVSKTFELGMCQFDSGTGVIVKNKKPRDDGSSAKEILCLDGEVHEDKDAISLTAGQYTMHVASNGNLVKTVENVEIGNGAAYTFTIFNDQTSGELKIHQIEDINSNDVSLLYIIPQFTLITMAELMVSITGMEFAYSQAPLSLKSVMQSFRLLTVSAGNIVVIIVAESKFLDSQVGEYLLFAGLIGAALIIFMLLSMFYYDYVPDGEFDKFEYPVNVTGVQLQESADVDSEGLQKSDVGESNEGFVEK